MLEGINKKENILISAGGLSRQDNEKVEHDRNAETTKEGRGPISDRRPFCQKRQRRGGFRHEKGERFNNFQQRDLSAC